MESNEAIRNHHSTTAPVNLRDSVKIIVNNYLLQMANQKVINIYDMVLNEIEEPLLQVIMKYTHQNQSRAALCLGMSRGNLRKKLARYGMLISG